MQDPAVRVLPTARELRALREWCQRHPGTTAVACVLVLAAAARYGTRLAKAWQRAVLELDGLADDDEDGDLGDVEGGRAHGVLSRSEWVMREREVWWKDEKGAPLVEVIGYSAGWVPLDADQVQDPESDTAASQARAQAQPQARAQAQAHAQASAPGSGGEPTETSSDPAAQMKVAEARAALASSPPYRGPSKAL